MRARELPSAGPPARGEAMAGTLLSPARGDATPGTLVSPARADATPGTLVSPARARAPADAGGPLVLERYRLRRRLGTGAFGTVWQAHDERLHRDVAVKILPRERIAGGRFEREARAAARLSHPGIVTLYEAAVDDEGAYLVSELVRGSALDRLLEQGRLSDRAIVTIGRALCDALAHAHEQGVVHRDVKPSNVLIPRRPATPSQVAKLTDFGVARVIGGNPLTRTGDVLGTAAYMAPEQAEGRPADAAADLYSLALVVYEALTGFNPLAEAPRTRRLGTYLPPLRRQRRDLPRRLGQAIDLALRPRPRERGTIQELRAALEGSIPEMGDRAGVVEAPRLRRLTSPAADRPDRAGRSGDGGRETGNIGRFLDQSRDRVAAARRESGAADPGHAADLGRAADPPITPRAPAWTARALAGATAAALAAWLAAHLLPGQPIRPGTAALLAGLLTAALPRIGWLSLAAGTTAYLAANHRPGSALLIAVAAILPALTLPRTPTSWPLPAIAPALGVVGLAGAWPALAAKARTAPRRAALAAAGWIVIALATALAHKSLYTKTSFPPPSRWTHSASAAAADVLSPLLTASTLVAATVWALAAAMLPILCARTPRSAHPMIVVAWATILTVLTAIAAPAILGGMAALGAVACVVFTLASDVTNRVLRPTPREDFRSMEPR